MNHSCHFLYLSHALIVALPLSGTRGSTFSFFIRLFSCELVACLFFQLDVNLTDWRNNNLSAHIRLAPGHF